MMNESMFLGVKWPVNKSKINIEVCTNYEKFGVAPIIRSLKFIFLESISEL